jgi:toxin ParE1/3/4
VTGKPVRPLELANRDIDAAIELNLNEASEKVALGFIDELQRSFARISMNPSIGSPR